MNLSPTKGQLHLAGWLSITNAAVTIPIAGLFFFLTAMGGAGAKMLEVALNVISLGLFVYVFATLRTLLNSQFKFYHVDTYISLIICISVIVTLLDVLSLLNPECRNPLTRFHSWYLSYMP